MLMPAGARHPVVFKAFDDVQSYQVGYAGIRELCPMQAREGNDSWGRSSVPERLNGMSGNR